MIWSNLLSFASLSERLSAPWAFDPRHVAVSLTSTLLSWDSLTSTPPPYIQLRPLPLHISVGLRRVATMRLTCSARVLSQHLDGLLRGWLASLLHPAAGRGSPLLRPSTQIRRPVFQDTVVALTQRIHPIVGSTLLHTNQRHSPDSRSATRHQGAMKHVCDKTLPP
jgi:hypothetical protein